MQSDAPAPERLSPDEPASPRCPYCGLEPLSFRSSIMQTPTGQTLFLTFCANKHCRRALSLDLIDMGQRVVQPGR